MSLGSLFRRLLCGAAMVLVAACGGGGDGDPGSDAPIEVTLSSPSVSAAFVRGDPNSSGPALVQIMATLSALPAGKVYAYLVEDEAVLDPSDFGVFQQGDRLFLVQLRPYGGLSVGVHQGVLTLRLCKDKACTSEYPIVGGTLPYKFDVAERLGVTMKVNGVQAADLNGFTESVSGRSLSINAPSGAVLELVSSIPVTWLYGSSAPATIIQTDATSTTWRGVVSGRTSFGSVDITARPLDTRQYDATFSILLPP